MRSPSAIDENRTSTLHAACSGMTFVVVPPLKVQTFTVVPTSGEFKRVELIDLSGKFEDSTRSLFRLKARVRGAAVGLDLINAGSLAAGFDTTGSGWFEHQAL